MAINEGVHVTHCCVHHGCKYNNEDCPVVLNKLEQQFPCEQCDYIEEERVELARAQSYTPRRKE